MNKWFKLEYNYIFKTNNDRSNIVMTMKSFPIEVQPAVRVSLILTRDVPLGSSRKQGY